ncbi:MAG: ABC transporter substrate-binding protein [Spirochaetaceae bacterium]|jgi:polar amino acid transport system substrate-binding protein|nr:ABC transporter substrate-binding protein [Spirochaetaceae bacterium]
MKRIFGLALMGLVVLCGVFAGPRKEQAQGLTIENGVLTVGMEIGYPPMEYFDTDGTTPIGFDVQMAKALAAKLGLGVKFVDTAWDGIFAGVDTGKYDLIISSVTITDERLTRFNFTKPYIANAQALVLPKGSTITARNLEGLSGLRVAYQAETTSDEIMTELAEGGLQFTPFEYDKVMNCFDELRNGRVDVVVCDSVVAYFYEAQPTYSVEIVWEGPGENLGICLKKGNDALTKAVSDALAALFADGTVPKISRDVFGRDLASTAFNN